MTRGKSADMKNKLNPKKIDQNNKLNNIKNAKNCDITSSGNQSQKKTESLHIEEIYTQ